MRKGAGGYEPKRAGHVAHRARRRSGSKPPQPDVPRLPARGIEAEDRPPATGPSGRGMRPKNKIFKQE
ncbi:hypothetical protein AT05_11165 [Schleiferia thermophila str. Yellowstone]|jgi:hypothetical protein|nr:hypothetical protein AT05_11165 [Schleiferia thermophila str. Yellowstone]